MILSCTKKVRDKLKKHKVISETGFDVGLHNWYVDTLRIGRKEYYLFTNSVTLYSIVIYFGTQNERKNIETIFKSSLIEALFTDFRVPIDLIESKLLDNEFIYSKTKSRAILGTMNDFKWQAEVQVLHKEIPEGKIESVRYWLNDCPMSLIGYSNGRMEMEKILLD